MAQENRDLRVVSDYLHQHSSCRLVAINAMNMLLNVVNKRYRVALNGERVELGLKPWARRTPPARASEPVVEPAATPPAETSRAIRWASRAQARAVREALVPRPPSPVVEPPLSPVVEPPPSPVVEPPPSPVVEPPLSPLVEPLSSPVVEPLHLPPVVTPPPPPQPFTSRVVEPPQPPPPPQPLTSRVVEPPHPQLLTSRVVTPPPPSPPVVQPPLPSVVTQPVEPTGGEGVEPTGGEGVSSLGGGGEFGWGVPDSEDYSSEEEAPTRARAFRSQPTEFDFSRDSLEEIRQKIETERAAIKDVIATGSKKMLRIGICSASLLDAMLDDFPTSHTPIEREKLERSYRERVEKKVGCVPDFGKALARLSRGVIFPHGINVKEVKVGGKDMLEASIVTKKGYEPTQAWVGLMGKLQPLLMKLATLEARAVMLERTRAAELESSQPPPEPPEGWCLDPHNFKQFKLVKKTQLSHNVAKFVFALPTPTSVLGLHVGHHISCRGKDSQGEEVIKPYTPTTLDSDLGHFDLVIKMYPGGRMSHHFREMRVGDYLDVKGPEGRSRYLPGRVRVIGMLAADYGITPMFRVARAILENPTDTTMVHLIYANETYEDILLKDELDGLIANYPDRIKVCYVLNQPPEGWNGGVGLVSKEMIQTHCPAPAAGIQIWMCGPPPMIEATVANLVALGYPPGIQFQF